MLVYRRGANILVKSPQQIIATHLYTKWRDQHFEHYVSWRQLRTQYNDPKAPSQAAQAGFHRSYPAYWDTGSRYMCLIVPQMEEMIAYYGSSDLMLRCHYKPDLFLINGRLRAQTGRIPQFSVY